MKEHKLRPAYVFVGDEAFFRKRCRDAVLGHLIPSDMRDFSLYDFDLAEMHLAEILDRARTPSLMAPFQVFFVRGVKELYGRGSHEAEFTAIREYVENPNPDAILIFVADHISIPSDPRRMEMTDRDRYERIRETLGEFCTIIELARVEESEAVRWVNDTAASENVKVDADAAREMVDALGGDMMLVAAELEKLILYVGDKKKITLGDVETMVLAAKQRTLYELTDAISAKDRERGFESPRCNPLHRRRRRGCDRPPVHARQDLPPDAGDLRAQGSRFARAVAGTLAGLPIASLCRRRRDTAGSPLPVAPRTYPRTSSDCARRPGITFESAKQTLDPGTTRSGPFLAAAPL